MSGRKIFQPDIGKVSEANIEAARGVMEPPLMGFGAHALTFLKFFILKTSGWPNFVTYNHHIIPNYLTKYYQKM